METNKSKSEKKMFKSLITQINLFMLIILNCQSTTVHAPCNTNQSISANFKDKGYCIIPMKSSKFAIK